MSNPFERDFTEEQLADYYNRIEQETRRGYDLVAEGVWMATRDFARSLSPVYDDCGELLVEESPEWEDWVEDLHYLVFLPQFQPEDFDAVAYWKKQREARQLEVSNV